MLSYWISFGAEAEADNLQYSVQELVMIEKNTSVMENTMVMNSQSLLNDCIPIQPNIHLETSSEEYMPYAFGKQLVLDIGVHLQQQPSDTLISSSSRGGSNSALRYCYVCQKKTTVECMHGHICWHILNEDKW